MGEVRVLERVQGPIEDRCDEARVATSARSLGSRRSSRQIRIRDASRAIVHPLYTSSAEDPERDPGRGPAVRAAVGRHAEAADQVIEDPLHRQRRETQAHEQPQGHRPIRAGLVRVLAVRRWPRSSRAGTGPHEDGSSAPPPPGPPRPRAPDRPGHASSDHQGEGRAQGRVPVCAPRPARSECRDRTPGRRRMRPVPEAIRRAGAGSTPTGRPRARGAPRRRGRRRPPSAPSRRLRPMQPVQVDMTRKVIGPDVAIWPDACVPGLGERGEGVLVAAPGPGHVMGRPGRQHGRGEEPNGRGRGRRRGPGSSRRRADRGRTVRLSSAAWTSDGTSSSVRLSPP